MARLACMAGPVYNAKLLVPLGNFRNFFEGILMEGFTFDSRGLIYNNDGGDCARETGTYYSGLWLRKYVCGLDISEYPLSTAKDFHNALNQLEIHPGLYVRSPDPGPQGLDEPWNDPSNFSRDQQTSIECALSFWRLTDDHLPFRRRLHDLLFEQSRRPLRKYQNIDIPNPAQWMIKKRVLEKPGRIARWWADSFLLWQSMLQQDKGPDDVADDINHTQMIAQAMIWQPTYLTKVARASYKQRKPTFGSLELGEQHPVMGAWKWYYRSGKSTLTGMPELWRAYIEKAF